MDTSERPNRIPWPPILFLGALAAANLLSWLIPVGFIQAGFLRLSAGIIIFAVSIALMGWALYAFRAHGTTVMPHRRSDALISSGPFRFTRNPIYLAEAVLLAGLALINGSIWYAAVILPFMWAVTVLAIKREEAHLAARFGQDWTEYAVRVRRWI